MWRPLLHHWLDNLDIFQLQLSSTVIQQKIRFWLASETNFFNGFAAWFSSSHKIFRCGKLWVCFLYWLACYGSKISYLHNSLIVHHWMNIFNAKFMCSLTLQYNFLKTWLGISKIIIMPVQHHHQTIGWAYISILWKKAGISSAHQYIISSDSWVALPFTMFPLLTSTLWQHVVFFFFVILNVQSKIVFHANPNLHQLNSHRHLCTQF